jgi:2-polyprenyl-3-methyl-5-hydroxy-6-metoxy-1,4-benzoquinol methylase
VLDVGTASGTLARFCSGLGFVLRGIEPNEKLAKEASAYYSAIINKTLEQTPETFLMGHDVVVCADVLEHLVDPGGQLKHLVTLQPDRSVFIISLPNIANIWIRLNLLFGRFEYSERGILDRTHLHFFTLKTLRSFLFAAGLKIIRLEATPIPLDLLNPFFSQNILGKWIYAALAYLTTIWPSLLGYQFILKACKFEPKRSSSE